MTSGSDEPAAPQRHVTCREVSDFLLEYLSAELDPAVRTSFDAHLAHCAHCAAYLESYHATVRLARSLGRPLPDEAPEPVPEDLIAAILAARSSR
jgi:anti-sigma factor RsiW